MKRPLALEQIQSHILRGFQYGQAPHHAHYLFFKFDGVTPPQQWIAAVRGLVTTAAEDATPTVGLGLSYPGFQALGVDPFQPSDSFSAFVDGMVKRAPLIDDIGDSAPAHWWLGAQDVHAYVSVEGNQEAALAPLLAEVRRVPGATRLFEVHAAARPDHREPFGFVDGISQPDIEGSPIAQPPGHGTLTSDGKWRQLQPGEFVLGYDDEEGPTATPAALDDGSFFVFRLLVQDVHGFHRYVEHEARKAGVSQEELKAKLVGRLPDGRPLVNRPDGSFDFQRDNAFRFGQDPSGYACPHGAHIRRANPRDTLEKEADRVERHRIIRRALPFQHHGDVGVCFGVVNASIERQFEFVQQRWINAGSTSKRLGHSRDPMLGDNHGEHLIIPGDPPRVVGGIARFVRTRGGGYFFLPSRRLLEELAEPKAKPLPQLRVAPRAEIVPPAPFWPQLRLAVERLPVPQFGTSPEKRTWVMITPLDRAALPALTRELAAQQRELDGRFADVRRDGRPIIHYARFALFGELEHEPAPFPHAYLLFACNHDGSPWQFVQALWSAFRAAPFPFDRCLGYPRRGGFLSFACYFFRYHYPTAFSFAMYPSTVEEVVNSLQVRRYLRSLVEETQADSSTFAAAYKKFVSKISRYL